MYMKQTLVSLAGYPGTGKTYLSQLIQQKIGAFQEVSPDTIKERNWDIFGFDTLEEKESLIQLSWKEYYLELEEWFKRYKNTISDYPFSCKQHDQLRNLTDKYQYQVITVRLISDLNILFERQKNRDLNTNRHLGHIVLQYHKGMKLQNHKQADNLLTKEEFFDRCLNRGYQSFSLGKLYEVDVTDFSKVDYSTLLNNIKQDIYYR